MKTETGNCPYAPGRAPLLGHLPAVMRDPVGFFECTRTADPVVRVRLASLNLYLVNEPETVRRLQIDGEAFERGRFFDQLAGHFGRPPIALDGAPHAAQRRVLKPAFNTARVASHSEMLRRNAAGLADSWRAGLMPDVKQQVADYTASCVLHGLLGGDLSQEEIHDIQRTIHLVALRLLPGTLLPAALGALPTPGKRTLDSALLRFRRLVTRMIAERERERRPPAAGSDVLDALLRAGIDDDGPRLSPAQIQGELLILLFAALETTSTTLNWALLELASHPRAARPLYAEADRLAADHPLSLDPVHPHASAPHAPQPSYARRVLQETMRLHSPILFTRRTRHAVELDGVRLPAGAEVGYSPRAMHRNPLFHPDPLSFDPYRPSLVSAHGPRGAFIPFGIGPHRCIAEHFAMAVLAAALTAIASRWELALPANAEIVESPSSLPEPKAVPLLLTPRRRDSAEQEPAALGLRRW